VTKDGLLGIGPPGLPPEDSVDKGRFPIILRHNSEESLLVGVSFVLGLPDNEAAKMVQHGKVMAEEFCIARIN
jgi:hypothetical protein